MYYERKNHFTALVEGTSKADECLGDEEEDECLYHLIEHDVPFPENAPPLTGEASSLTAEQVELLEKFDIRPLQLDGYMEAEMKEDDDKGTVDSIAAFTHFTDTFVFKKKPFICDFDTTPDGDDLPNYIPHIPHPVSTVNTDCKLNSYRKCELLA